MLAEREAPAQGKREKVSALAQEAALAFFVPCCTRGLLSYCQLLWCQRVSKQWNADVLVALRHLSCLDFRASCVDGALPPPPADAPGAYHVLHHRNSRRTLSRDDVCAMPGRNAQAGASQEVTLDQCPAEVTDVAIALERVGPGNLVHLDLSQATGLYRELPKGSSDDLFAQAITLEREGGTSTQTHELRVRCTAAGPLMLWEDTKKWVDQIKKISKTKQQILQVLAIDEHTLDEWYRGDNRSPSITTSLRQRIKIFMDRRLQQKRAHEQRGDDDSGDDNSGKTPAPMSGGGSGARKPSLLRIPYYGQIGTLLIAKNPPLTTLIYPNLRTTLSMKVVRHFTGLTRLDLSTPRLADDYGLYRNSFRPVFPDTLAAGISSLTCLQHLDLSGNFLGPRFLDIALQMTSLRELHLENIVKSVFFEDDEDMDIDIGRLWWRQGGPEVWKKLEQSLAKQSRLQVLNLEGSGCVPIGAAEAISRALGSLHQLQHLCFPPLGQRLTTLDCEAIASLSLLQSLDMHEANRQEGREAFVSALRSNGGLPYLRTLRLRRDIRCLYWDSCCESACSSLVKCLPHMPALETLCLHNWNFTKRYESGFTDEDQFAHNLWRGLAVHCTKYSRLCRLNLEPCEIGGRKGLALLAKEAANMSSLRSLCVKVSMEKHSGERITRREFLEIRALLPPLIALDAAVEFRKPQFDDYDRDNCEYEPRSYRGDGDQGEYSSDEIWDDDEEEEEEEEEEFGGL